MSNLSNARPSRFKNSDYRKTDSSSRLSSGVQTSRSLWARSYKNQPVPTQISRRLMGKKYQFDDSDEEADEQVMAVLEQSEQQQIQQKGRLSKLKVIRDWDEFSQSTRQRINSMPNLNLTRQRCRSVAEFKLPQVPEQKKQEQQQKRKPLSRLSQVKDANEFNQIAHRISSDGSSCKSKAESLQTPKLKLLGIPEQMIENDIDETRSQIMHIRNRKLKLSQSLSKLIVDQIDMKQRLKQKQNKHNKEQMRVIEEQKQEQEADTGKLSDLILKFEGDNKMLDRIQDDKINRNTNDVEMISQ